MRVVSSFYSVSSTYIFVGKMGEREMRDKRETEGGGVKINWPDIPF